jgi:hypothetical protein
LLLAERACDSLDPCTVLAPSVPEVAMQRVVLDLPVLGFVVVTRAALAAGVALLAAGRLSEARRRTIGLALIGIGAATTLPAVISVVRGSRGARAGSSVRVDKRLIGVARYPRKGDDPFG